MSAQQSVRSRRAGDGWPGVPPALLVGGCAALIVGGLIAFGRLALPEGGLTIAVLSVVTALAIRLRRHDDKPTDEDETPSALDPAVERFADTLIDPCLVINERAVLLYGNTAYRARFPRARSGDPLAFTLRDPDLVEAIDKAIRSGEPQTTELHIAAPNVTWLRAAIVPYAPGDGAPSLFVVSLYDLTEQKRTDRMRTDFIANASHELRTPLTSLIGFIDTLQGPAAKDEAARGRFLGIMRGQAERMSGLIDDLLSLTRIELRQHLRPTTQIDLAALLSEIADSLEPRIREAGIALEMKLPGEAVMISGDRQELFEVVENLADNAIKYGADGGRVEIALIPGASRSGAHHAITVTDFGVGIAEEHVPRLTERFYRVDAESSRRKKGTGLGLAIVKHIVARHHGQMSIRSAQGEGTTVEILLPR